jgi:hypothetical protein
MESHSLEIKKSRFLFFENLLFLRIPYTFINMQFIKPVIEAKIKKFSNLRVIFNTIINRRENNNNNKNLSVDKLLKYCICIS